MHTQQEPSSKDSEGPKKLIGEVSPTEGLREALAQLLDSAAGGVLRVASKDVTGFVGLRSGTIIGAIEKKSNTNGLDALARILATRKGLWGLMDESSVEKIPENIDIGIKPLLDWRTADGEPLDLELALQCLVKGETPQAPAAPAQSKDPGNILLQLVSDVEAGSAPKPAEATSSPAAPAVSAPSAPSPATTPQAAAPPSVATPPPTVPPAAVSPSAIPRVPTGEAPSGDTPAPAATAAPGTPARNKASLDNLLRLDVPMEDLKAPEAAAPQPQQDVPPQASQQSSEQGGEHKTVIKEDGSILDVWGGEAKVDSPPPVSLSKITLVNMRSPVAPPKTQEEMSSEEAMRVYEESMKRVAEFQERALQTDDQGQSQSERLQPPPPPQNEPQDLRTTMSMPSQAGPQSKPNLPAVPLDPRTTGNRSQEEIIKAGNQVFADIEKSLSGSIPKIDPNSARPTFGTPNVVSNEDEIPSLESESLMPQTPQSSARTTAQFPHQSGAARTSGGWPEQPPAPTPGWQQQAQQAASQQGASKPTAQSAMPSKADLAAIPTPTNLSGGAPKPNQASRPSAADLNAIPTPASKPSTGGAKASPSRTELDAIPTPSQTTSQKMPAQTSSQKMPVQQAPSAAVKKPKKKISGLASVVLTVVLSSSLLIGVVLLANGAMNFFHNKQTMDMAMLFFKEGNYPLASKKFDEYIQNKTHDVSAYFYRAITSAKLGDYEKAASDYEQILRLRPGSPKALAGRASMRIKLADYEGAVADTDAALRTRPGDFDSLRIRSIAYVHLGQFEKALADCNTCMQKNPTRGLAEIYSSRGFAYYRMQKFSEALADYNRAIEISPKDINAHSSRAQVYSTMKKYEQALDDLNKVTYWSPRNASAYMLRAQTYKALKKKEKAMQDYDMVITLMPTPENYQTRADVQLEFGNLKGALGDYDHILEIQPANKKVQERRKALFAKVLASKQS